MAILQSGVDSTLQTVDPSSKAARVSLRPVEVLGWYSVGANSGAYTGASAGSLVFSMRNTGSNFLMLRRLSIGFAVTTAFTTAQAMAFSASVARAFTASDSTGTVIALTGSQNKHRTSLATPTGVDMRIATTIGMTNGTKTVDTVPFGTAAGAAQGVGAVMAPVPLFSHDTGDYPLILAANEGINVNSLIAMGAAGVVQLQVNVEFAEVAAY